MRARGDRAAGPASPEEAEAEGPALPRPAQRQAAREAWQAVATLLEAGRMGSRRGPSVY